MKWLQGSRRKEIDHHAKIDERGAEFLKSTIFLPPTNTFLTNIAENSKNTVIARTADYMCMKLKIN